MNADIPPANLPMSPEDAPVAQIDARRFDPAPPTITPTPEGTLLHLRGFLGHRSLDTTLRYLHTSPEDALTALMAARAGRLDPAHPAITPLSEPEELAMFDEIRNSTGDDK